MNINIYTCIHWYTHTYMYVYIYIHIYTYIYMYVCIRWYLFERVRVCVSVGVRVCACVYSNIYIGWLTLVGSIKLYVSFAEYSLFYRGVLQKRPIISSILLTKATQKHLTCVYTWVRLCMSMCLCFVYVHVFAFCVCVWRCVWRSRCNQNKVQVTSVSHHLFTWVIHMWHASSIFSAWRTHMCGMTHSYVRHELFICAT